MGLFGFGKSKEEKKRLKDKAEEEFLKYRVVNISPETARKIKNDPDNISHHVIPDMIAHGKRLKELERDEIERQERQKNSTDVKDLASEWIASAEERRWMNNDGFPDFGDLPFDPMAKKSYLDDWDRLQNLEKKAHSLYELKKYEESIACCDETIKLNRKNMKIQLWKNDINIIRYFGRDAWHIRGISLYALGRYEESIACFDELIKLYPEDSFVWMCKGDVLKKLGRDEDAEQCFTKSKELKDSS